MADKKITALDDLGTALNDVDLFHIVDDPSNTPINKRVSAKNVFNNVPSYIGLAQAFRINRPHSNGSRYYFGNNRSKSNWWCNSIIVGLMVLMVK